MADNRKKLNLVDLLLRPGGAEEDTVSVSVPVLDTARAVPYGKSITDILGSASSLRPLQPQEAAAEVQVAAPAFEEPPRNIPDSRVAEFSPEPSPEDSLMARYFPDVKSDQVRRILGQKDRGILDAILPQGQDSSQGAPQGQLPTAAFSTGPVEQGQRSGDGIVSRITDWLSRNDIGDRITDYAIGMSQGATPSQSAAFGAQNLYRGNVGRNEARQAEQEAMQARELAQQEEVQQQLKDAQTLNYLRSIGYSDDDSIAMISDPKLLNSVLTNRFNVQPVDPLADLKREQMELSNARTRQDMDLKASTTAQQQAATEEADAKKAQEAATSKRAVLTAIGDARKIAESGWLLSPATGNLNTVASHSPVGGQKAKDLRAVLDMIDANSAFDKVASMRASSPTGAGLGPLSDADMRLLRAASAALDPSQSKEQFIKNLDRYEATLRAVTEGDRLMLEDPKSKKVFYVPASRAYDLINEGARIVGSAPPRSN